MDSEKAASGSNSTSAAVCDMSALTVLVSEDACPTLHTCTLVVRELVAKRKGLSAFFEQHCANTECPSAVLTAVHTSSSAVPGDLADGASGNRDYQSAPATASLRTSRWWWLRTRLASCMYSCHAFAPFLAWRCHCIIRTSQRSTGKFMLQP